MSFTSKLGKVLDRLYELFNDESLLPEQGIQQEMKKEGWHFDSFCIVAPYAFAPIIQIVNTPEGRPAIGSHATPEDHKRYLDTVAEKRRQLLLVP